MILSRAQIRLIARLYWRLPPLGPAWPGGRLRQLTKDVQQHLEPYARSLQLLEHVRSRGWPNVTTQLERRLRSQHRRLQELVNTGGRLLDGEPPLPFTLADFLAEVEQLRQEFGAVQLNLKERQLSVTTEPIVLDGVYLGRFTIRLELRYLTSPGAESFAIVADDPQPSATNANVPHPHVQGHDLCAGDARLPIALALRQRRLADAFIAVRSVLRTYNESSAFAKLESWEVETCHGCDDGVEADALLSCAGCNERFCAGCVGPCAACGEDHCDDCRETCVGCQQTCCPLCRVAVVPATAVCCRRCAVQCSRCQRARLPVDATGTPRLCPDCRDRPTETHSDPLMENAHVPLASVPPGA